MVVDESGIIFVHVPRTGGTSIEKIFDKPLGDTQPPTKIISEVGMAKWRQYFKFAVVRHPLDRLVSTYMFREQLQVYSREQMVNNQTEAIIHPSMPFDEYVTKVYQHWQNINRDIPDLESQWLLSGGAFADHPDLLALYPAGQPVVDYMIRFENFEEDLKGVLNIFGMSDREIPHLNKTIRQPYQSYYSTETAGKAKDIYRNDFLNFSYGLD